MVAAIELSFDRLADRRLRRLWSALGAAGVPSLSTHTHRRHRPHLSLAVADAFDPVAVQAALADLPVPTPGLTLEFQYVGMFGGGVLWLGPSPSDALLTLHTEVYRRLTAAGVEIWAHYAPGAWVPHTTLSMTARSATLTTAVPLCLDVLPLTATLTGATVADHTRGIYHPLPPPAHP
ncbi:MAG TPA: 2'-5' RNA ligase family protein [Micromonosporaceae bacterium]